MHDCILQIGFRHLGLIFLKIYNKSVFQISDNWAVTAAHCFFDEIFGNRSIKTKEDFSLVIGVHDRAVVEDILVTDTGESAGHW